LNNLSRYIIITIVVATILFAAWYFMNIIAYILIAAILTLIGRPIVEGLQRVRYKKLFIPRWLSALLALIFIWGIFVTFFSVFIPLIATEANELSMVDIGPLLEQMQGPLDKLNHLFIEFNIGEGEYHSIEEYLMEKIHAVMNISLLSSVFSTLTTIMGDLFIAIFAISFIMFFFLKDASMFSNGIMLLVPTKHEKPVSNALKSIRRLLMRYFIGIMLQITAIIILVTIGLTIVGVNFHRSLVIGLFVGIINIVPYVGPFIGAIFGVIIGSAGYIEMELAVLLPKIMYMSFVFLTVQIMDNVLFQPLIYGSSVNAHPLEIFLVIMIAGSVAGIPGMILAVPGYTIFRVFAREFLFKFKLVKKITEKIPANNT
jgi:predicted PurR-regulated permease PerM